MNVNQCQIKRNNFKKREWLLKCLQNNIQRVAVTPQDPPPAPVTGQALGSTLSASASNTRKFFKIPKGNDKFWSKSGGQTQAPKATANSWGVSGVVRYLRADHLLRLQP